MHCLRAASGASRQFVCAARAASAFAVTVCALSVGTEAINAPVAGL